MFAIPILVEIMRVASTLMAVRKTPQGGRASVISITKETVKLGARRKAPSAYPIGLSLRTMTILTFAIAHRIRNARASECSQLMTH